MQLAIQDPGMPTAKLWSLLVVSEISDRPQTSPRQAAWESLTGSSLSLYSDEERWTLLLPFSSSVPWPRWWGWLSLPFKSARPAPRHERPSLQESASRVVFDGKQRWSMPV